MNTKTNIFRFKLSAEFYNQLVSFSKLHQHDDRITYKHNWDRWVHSNNNIIENESNRLTEQGYTGNIIDKMYKSGRYYYRTKKPTNEPKKRRKYIAIEPDLIENMDNHIKDNINSTTFKPSYAYDVFTKEYDSVILIEIDKLIENGLDIEQIKLKIKKTYKNRYFLHIQNSKNSDLREM
jgi:hypothetical protein